MSSDRATSDTKDPAYISDVAFPSGFVRQQQPTLLAHVVAGRGMVPPDAATPYVYLELGCGAGVTLNGLAASNPEARFIGIDFNRQHLDAAAAAAAAANLDNVRYIESAFADAAAASLPDADFVAINGAYSWLDPPSKAAVHDIVCRVLKPGGLFYVEYMAMPGHAHAAPLIEFLRRSSAAVAEDSRARVRYGIDALAQLQAAKARYLMRNPGANDMLTRLTKSKHTDAWIRSFAHDALAQYRRAEFFPDMSDRFRAMGLHHAGSLAVDANDPSLSLPPELRDMADETGDPDVIELVTDFHHNRRQRLDVFIKSPVFDATAAAEVVGEKLPIALIADDDLCRRQFRKFAGSTDESVLAEAKRITARLGSGPVTVAELCPGSDTDGGRYAVPSAVTWLLARNLATVCKRAARGGQHAGDVRFTTGSSFNARRLEVAAQSWHGIDLASPVIGGCVHLSALEGCVLALLADGGAQGASGREIVNRVRALPGPFPSRRGPVSGRSLGRNDILTVHRSLLRTTVPMLLALESLTAA